MNFPNLFPTAAPPSLAILALASGILSAETPAQPEQAADLAKKLNNPVADLISVPLQNNFLFNAGVSQVFKLGKQSVSILEGNMYERLENAAGTVIYLTGNTSGLATSMGIDKFAIELK